MGIKVRDVDDLFVGAPFRDEKTKLLFAYDYDNKFCIRVQAANIKTALYNEVKRRSVDIYDRVIITGLPNEGAETKSWVQWAQTCTPGSFMSS
jgi:hypothetical protein